MFNRVKGTSDYITSDIEKREGILREFFRLIELNCFNLVETPILESAWFVQKKCCWQWYCKQRNVWIYRQRQPYP